MKNIKQAHADPAGGGPVSSEGAFATIDGLMVAGKRGVLRVVLSPASLEFPLSAPKITHWLLPLDQPEIVRHASELQGEILWLCRRPPGEVAGGLVLDFCGAWLEGKTAILQLAEPEQYDLTIFEDPVFDLARIVAMRWAGYSEAAVRKSLLPRKKGRKLGDDGAASPGKPYSYSQTTVHA